MITATDSTQPHVHPIPYASPSAWWPAYAPDEIAPGLWQGGTEDDEVVGGRIPAGHTAALAGRRPPFDTVITLYADAQPAGWGVEELRFGFPDAELTPEFARRVIELARHAHRRWRAGGRVLIRCQAGVNRSGLVTALTLMLDGHSAHEAIALIRAQRAPAALNNGAFVRWLVTEAQAQLATGADGPALAA
jgi:hypothetical protein